MLSRIYDRHLAPARINISQFALLSHVGREPGMGASSLAAGMSMERTTLLRALKPLQALGLVEAVKEGQNLRYRLTTEGEQVLGAATPYWRAAQAEFEKLFGARRAAELRGDMLALAAMA